MSIPNEPTDPTAEALGENPDVLRWHGLGQPTQVAMGWVVANPGVTPHESDLPYLNWLAEHGYIYARQTKDRGVIFFATLVGSRIFHNGTRS